MFLEEKQPSVGNVGMGDMEHWLLRLLICSMALEDQKHWRQDYIGCEPPSKINYHLSL